VPQVPYLATVPLRDLVRPDPLDPTNDDDAVRAALTAVGFDPVLARIGGLDAAHDWSSKLSLGEQHLLALARLLVAKPKFAVLDETFSGLEPKRVGSLCLRLAEAGITYVTLDLTEDLAGFHDTILILDGHGGWKFGEARESPEKYIG
jgi:putative ATP-binding cassette transporter